MVQDIIKQHVVAMGLEFGHGPRTYQNIQDGSYPMVWLWPYVVEDEITRAGSMFHKYNVILDLHRKCSLDDGPEHLEEILRKTFDDSKELLLRLSQDPRVDAITGLRREPMYHVLDSNLAGYGIAFELKTKFEPFKYCYPSP